MSRRKAASPGPLLPLPFLLLVILFGTIIVSHDYFCHDHLHELCSPLHAFYDNPEPFEAGSFFGSPPPPTFLPSSNERIHHDVFIKNIFHPPDCLS